MLILLRISTNYRNGQLCIFFLQNQSTDSTSWHIIHTFSPKKPYQYILVRYNVNDLLMIWYQQITVLPLHFFQYELITYVSLCNKVNQA